MIPWTEAVGRSRCRAHFDSVSDVLLSRCCFFLRPNTQLTLRWLWRMHSSRRGPSLIKSKQTPSKLNVGSPENSNQRNCIYLTLCCVRTEYQVVNMEQLCFVASRPQFSYICSWRASNVLCGGRPCDLMKNVSICSALHQACVLVWLKALPFIVSDELPWHWL